MSASKGNNFPKPPTARPLADSELGMLLQSLYDMVWDPKVNMFVDSPQIKFDKTPRGYSVRLKPSFGGKKSTPAIPAQYFAITALGGYDYVTGVPIAITFTTQSTCRFMSASICSD